MTLEAQIDPTDLRALLRKYRQNFDMLLSSLLSKECRQDDSNSRQPVTHSVLSICSGRQQCVSYVTVREDINLVPRKAPKLDPAFEKQILCLFHGANSEWTHPPLLHFGYNRCCKIFDLFTEHFTLKSKSWDGHISINGDSQVTALIVEKLELMRVEDEQLTQSIQVVTQLQISVEDSKFFENPMLFINVQSCEVTLQDTRLLNNEQFRELIDLGQKGKNALVNIRQDVLRAIQLRKDKQSCETSDELNMVEHLNTLQTMYKQLDAIYKRNRSQPKEIVCVLLARKVDDEVVALLRCLVGKSLSNVDINQLEDGVLALIETYEQNGDVDSSLLVGIKDIETKHALLSSLVRQAHDLTSLQAYGSLLLQFSRDTTRKNLFARCIWRQIDWLKHAVDVLVERLSKLAMSKANMRFELQQRESKLWRWIHAVEREWHIKSFSQRVSQEAILQQVQVLEEREDDLDGDECAPEAEACPIQVLDKTEGGPDPLAIKVF